MYICATRVSDARVGQKKASDHLELELQMVEKHHLGAGTQTGVLQEQVLLATESSIPPLKNFKIVTKL